MRRRGRRAVGHRPAGGADPPALVARGGGADPPAVRRGGGVLRRDGAGGRPDGRGDPAREAATGMSRGARGPYFARPEVFSATAARISAFNAFSSILSPSWISMARRVLPSRLELKRPTGSGSEAPLANVIFTTFLYVSPVQTIPACDHTGTPAGLDGFLH